MLRDFFRHGEIGQEPRVAALSQLLDGYDMRFPAINLESAELAALGKIILRDGSGTIRFPTLSALCRALECQPGDLLEHSPREMSLPE